MRSYFEGFFFSSNLTDMVTIRISEFPGKNYFCPMATISQATHLRKDAINFQIPPLNLNDYLLPLHHLICGQKKGGLT